MIQDQNSSQFIQFSNHPFQSQLFKKLMKK